MRYCAVHAETELAMPSVRPEQPVPSGVKFMYLPRVRCLDCPGKLYTPGPDTTIINFEVHLKNKAHREKVDSRIARSGVGSSARPSPARSVSTSGGGGSDAQPA